MTNDRFLSCTLLPTTYNVSNSDILFLYQVNWVYPISSLSIYCKVSGAQDCKILTVKTRGSVVLKSSRNTLKNFLAMVRLVPPRSTLASFIGKPCNSPYSGVKSMGHVENNMVTVLLYETEAPNGRRGIVLKLLSWPQK